MSIQSFKYCMLELVFFKVKVLSHTDSNTVHVAKDASESARIQWILPAENWQNSVLFLVSFMHVSYV